jgi:hypothetical protein
VQAASSFAEDGAGFVVDFLSTSEGLLLNKAFVRIKEPKVRRKIIDLVNALADEQPSSHKDKAEDEDFDPATE